MDNEKRMAGDYEVFQAISVGPREIVMGENKNAVHDERYLCAYCESCDLFERYTEGMVSDDYLEILQLYGQRIQDEAERLRNAVTLNPALKIDDSPVESSGYTPVKADDDLRNKVVIIRPDVLKREYQRATHQYMLVSGGFGASPNSRGSKVYCTNLFSGKDECFRRYDVLGIAAEEQLPDWARDGLKLAEQKRSERAMEVR